MVLEMRSSLIIMELLAVISKVDSFIINKICRRFIFITLFFFIFLFLLLFGIASLLQLPLRLHICVVFMFWLSEIMRMLLALVHLVPRKPQLPTGLLCLRQDFAI
jgi:hypothetical protein